VAKALSAANQKDHTKLTKRAIEKPFATIPIDGWMDLPTRIEGKIFQHHFSISM
jgi:hypothetical protein